jgi:8-oxo-dGTP pyrophosphatase MutT (NUDIX family)
VEKIKSCGFLIYRNQPCKSILLMKHPKRWDLPKGHVDEGETNLQCALRELQEETAIESVHIRIDPDFKYKDRYIINKRGGPKKKKLVIYLAELIEDVEIRLTEHEGFEWVPWSPPHSIQEKTIDPLLRHLQDFWAESDGSDEAKEEANENASNRNVSNESTPIPSPLDLPSGIDI